MNNIQWQGSGSKHPAKRDESALKPSSNIWFSVSLGLLGIIVGYTLGTWNQPGSIAARQNPTAAAPAAPAAAPSVPAPAPNADLPKVDFAVDHYKGNKGADIAIVEYSDYECPFCTRAHPTLTQIMDDYGEKVVWVYRHFPLSFHPNAQPTAEASECVAELGGNEAFWKFTDAVYTSEDPFADLAQIAQDSGVNKAAFTTCKESGKYRQNVLDEAEAGGRAGVRGTPATFVVNLKTNKTQMVSGAQPIQNFKSVIDAMF